jgi:hypothetical protein
LRDLEEDDDLLRETTSFSRWNSILNDEDNQHHDNKNYQSLK